ncbi:MAG TPA: hypothetical protein VLZ05_19855 [Mycobacterium sp.]|nr:hypothetical protein [Mycobacterium sp.]HUH70929.1 hypothetical protein [Mycobacterium sp.]
MTLILLSGRPGAGKTKFAEWLHEHRGFTHIETDTAAGWATLEDLLNAFQSPEGTAIVRDKARALGEKVVIEWGFRVDDFGWVRRLRDDAGFDAWWLDGDKQASFQGFVNAKSGTHSPKQLIDAVRKYQVQADAIEEARPQLEEFYGDDHIIYTVTPGPTYLTFEKIASIMLPDER